MTATSGDGAALDRDVLRGACVGSGVIDLIEFLLPLWAGTGLALSGTGAGVLAAMVPLGSLMARPIAGRLVDGGRWALPIAGGLFASGAGCAGLALSSSAWAAAAAAFVLGAGLGAVLVTSLAHVVDVGAGDAGFGRMFAWESRGTTAALVFGVAATGLVGHRTVFAALAAACVLAGLPLLRLSGARSVRPVTAGGRRGGVALALVVVTSAAQNAVLLAAMLRLQRHDGLDVVGVATSMLPGLLVFMVAGSWPGVLVSRFSRRTVLTGCHLVVASGALVMAVYPRPVGVALGWFVAAAGIAVTVPLYRTTVADSGGPVGRALGRYGVATLTGAAAGSAAAGHAYATAAWPLVCGGIAVMLVGAAATARSVHPRET